MNRLVVTCPKCDGQKMKRQGIYRYKGKVLPIYKCLDCGRSTIKPLMKQQGQ
jgi:transposase-like protein